MPRLNEQDARAAEQAAEESSQRFEPVPDGVYIAVLKEVEVSDGPGASGFNYWTWKYSIVEEPYVNKPLRHITSLSPKAAFSVGGAFKAYGVPASTHTDDLIGQKVMAKVSVKPIATGPRKGELTNQVDAVLPYEEGDDKDLDDDF